MKLAAASRPKVNGALLPLLLGGGIAAAIVHLQMRFEHASLFIASAIVLIVSCLIMQRTVGVFQLRRMTMPGFWYLTYLAMIFTPSWFVFLNDPGAARYRYLFATHSVLLTVPLGILFVNMSLRFAIKEVNYWYEAPIQGRGDSIHLFAIYLLGYLTAAGIALLYVRDVQTIPLFHLIRNPGDYETLIVLREESFKLLDSPLLYVYYLLQVLGFPFLIMLALGYYLVSRRRTWLALFLLSLASGILYAAFSIANIPVVEIVVLIFLLCYLYRSGLISKKAVILGIVLVLVFPVAVLLNASAGSDVDVGVALAALGRRLFYAPAEVLYWYFDLFPGAVGYLYGRSIGMLSRVMGWQHFDTANYVGLYGLGSRIESVHANAACIGNFNADFGMVGVLLGGILVGILMQAVQVYLLRRPKTVVNLSVYAYLMFAFGQLHSTALPVVLASNGVILVLLLPAIIHTAVRILRTSTVQVATP